MKIDDYHVVVVSSYDEDELAAEIWKKKSETSTYDVGSVHIENGVPVLRLIPNEMDQQGEWIMPYDIFRKIVKELDRFLSSIGYAVNSEEDA